MISAAQIEKAYNDLYNQFRKYIWDFDTVVALAELETSCYTAFADLDKLRKLLKDLYKLAKDVVKEDEDFQDAFDAFEELIKKDSDIYVKLNVLREVM